MNAAVRAIVRTAARADVETVGFLRGFSGLIEDDAISLGHHEVANIIQRGGSILDTSRDDRFQEIEGRERAAKILEAHGCEGLVVIGGDGTHCGAASFEEEWDGAVVGITSTIDNDLGGTDQSIGFDTACNTALEAVDRIRDTAHALDRLFLIEVMGRHRGFIALEVAVGGGAEAVLCPEFELDTGWLLEAIHRNYERGKTSCIVIVAEGAHPGGARGLLLEIEDDLDDLERGAGPRVTILGHIQRGGNPTVADRVLASRIGVAAARAAIEGRGGRTFGVRGREVRSVSFLDALSEHKEIDRSLYDMVNTLA